MYHVKNHIEFNANDTHFTVVIFNANYKKGKENGKEKGKEKGEEIVKEIVKEIVRKPSITVKELAIKLNVSERVIRYEIDKLRNQVIIERKGVNEIG